MKKNIMLCTAAVAFLAGSQAHAAGYEKTIMWGGRSAGVAGIATPYTQGAQALYFNPAGIVMEKPGHEVTAQISPTWSQFKGPINNANDQVTSEAQVTTPFGLIYAGTIDDKFGFAIGGYTSGGAKSQFSDVSWGGAWAKPEVKTDIAINELGVGVAYRLRPELKIGAEYRYVMAKAAFSLAQRTASPNAIINIKMNNLSGNSSGFKLGAQYKAGEKTTLGLVYRSNVDITANGDLAVDQLTVVGGRTAVPVTSTTNAATTSFPQQVTLGAMHEYTNWRTFAEYSWTNYAKITSVDITGSFSTVVNPQVQQQWKDQHNVRLAGEYLGTSWPIRFGYGWTSQVTNSDWARASFTPPAAAHTLTAGSGQIFSIGGKPLQFDAGLEYTMASASGGLHAAGAATTANAAGTSDIRSGDYSVSAIALHTGLTYAF